MEGSSRIDDIGKLSGGVLIFGGVYGNLQALQAIARVAANQGIPPHNIFCTGDVAGYCAQPAECIAFIIEWAIHCILGNVEIQLSSGEDDCGCNFNEDGRCDLLSRNWYAYAKGQTGDRELAWMASLPDYIRFTYSGRVCVVLHGSAFRTAGYIFASTDWAEKQKNFSLTGADLIISGHSGLPFFQTGEDLYWLNAGAIGMPANDGESVVWYAMMDTEPSGDVKVRLCNLEYDHETAARLMLAAKLPEQYATTLQTGIWDNCEILPAEETVAQGKIILPTVHKIPGR